tara:strand:- start:1736 stop:2260 length:525 start_codon:yes stop_codon:yes gene_type:complete
MISSLALVINTKPILEKDTLVELFTLEYGRIRAFAKYSQSKKPRFGGQLNTFNLCNIQFNRRGDSFTISQINVVSSFEGIKKQYEKINVAYQFLYIIKTMTQINHENKEMFMILLDYLKELNENNAQDLHQFKLKFYETVLQAEGVLATSVKLNEKELQKMLESYTNIKFRDVT